MAQPEIPKKCPAGVVVNPGPDFHLEVKQVDVPEPGTYVLFQSLYRISSDTHSRPQRAFAQAQLYWPLYVGRALHAQ
jgi:hypothetical protein